MPITPNHGIFYPDRTMQVSEFRQHLATLAQSTDDALQSIIDGYIVTSDLSGLPSSGNWVGRRAWVTSLGHEVVWTGAVWETPGTPDDHDPSVFGALRRSSSYVIGANEQVAAFNQWVGDYEGVIMDLNGMRVTQPGIYAVDVVVSLTDSSGTNAARVMVNEAGNTYRYFGAYGQAGIFRLAWTEHLRLNSNDLVQISVSAGGTNTRLAASSEFSLMRVGSL